MQHKDLWRLFQEFVKAVQEGGNRPTVLGNYQSTALDLTRFARDLPINPPSDSGAAPTQDLPSIYPQSHDLNNCDQ